MITWFGALCLSSFLLQIQLNNMCLNRATLLVCGIFNEKKRGNLQLIHSLQSSKDGIWQHEGWFLSRHSYTLLKEAHSFSPFQLSSFRLHGFRAGPESFTAMLPIFIPSACWWINTNLELRWTQMLYLQTVTTLTVSRAQSASLGNINLNLDKWEELSGANIYERRILNGYFCFSWHFSTPGGLLFYVKYQGWEGASDDWAMLRSHLYNKSLLLAMGMYLLSSAGVDWSLWPVLCLKEDF